MESLFYLSSVAIRSLINVLSSFLLTLLDSVLGNSFIRIKPLGTKPLGTLVNWFLVGGTSLFEITTTIFSHRVSSGTELTQKSLDIDSSIAVSINSGEHLIPPELMILSDRPNHLKLVVDFKAT